MNNWQDSKPGRREKYEYLLDNHVSSDVTLHLKCGGEIVKIEAHKIILSAASTFFEALIFSSLISPNDDIVIEEDNVDMFKSLLGSIYCENKLIDDSYKLYEMAVKYACPDIVKMCRIKIGNSTPYFTMAKMCNFALEWNDIELIAMAKYHWRKNTYEFLSQSQHLADLEIDAAVMLFSEEGLNLPRKGDTELFFAITMHEKWSLADRQSLLKLLGTIRFLTMNVDTFKRLVVASNLLSVEECNSIEYHIIHPDVESKGDNNVPPMPVGFSTSRVIRKRWRDISQARRSPKINLCSDETTDWRDTHFGTNAKYKYMLEKELFTDTTLCLKTLKKTELIHVHRIVLIAASSYFETLFCNSWTPEDCDTFVINEPDIVLFKKLLKTIYVDDVKLISSIIHASRLYMMADKYSCLDVMDLCRRSMIRRIKPSTFGTIYNFSFVWKDSKLDEFCKITWCKDTDNIIASGSLEEVELDAAIGLFEQKSFNLRIGEVELVSAIAKNEKWRSAERESLLRLLHTIHFLTIDSTSFIEVVHPTGLLTFEEFSAIKHHILKLENNRDHQSEAILMPEGFNCSTVVRSYWKSNYFNRFKNNLKNTNHSDLLSDTEDSSSDFSDNHEGDCRIF